MEPRWKINKTPEKVRLWWKINKTPPWVSPAVVARNPAVVGILQWRSEISQPSSDATRFFSPFLGSESRKGRPKRGVPSRWHPGVDPKIWVIFLPGGGGGWCKIMVQKFLKLWCFMKKYPATKCRYNDPQKSSRYFCTTLCVPAVRVFFFGGCK